MTEKSSGVSAAARKLRNAFMKRKWLVIVLIAAILIFFGRVVDNKSLKQSAIVIGLGIDKTDNAFTVSTQSVVITGGAGEGQSSQSYAVYSAEGKTVSEALDKISQHMGLLVSLSHCNVLVLSQNVLRSDLELLAAPLIGAYALPEQAVVTSCTEKPSDILAARTGTTVAASYFIQSSLLQNLGGDGLAMVTVKDFLAHTLSRSASVNIPLVELEKLEDNPQTPDGESKDNFQLIMNRNLVVSENGSFVLEEEPAQATTLLIQHKVLGKLSPVLPTGEAVEFRVLDVKSSAKADGMSVHAEIEIKVSFMEAQNTPSDERITPSSPIVKAAAKELEKEIAENLYLCYTLSVENNADFLHLENEVYKKMGRHTPENCLSDIAFSCSVKVSVSENG